MSAMHTGIYVEATGHVLAAFSAKGNPEGKFSDEDQAKLLRAGVGVRLLKPAPQRLPFLVAFVNRQFRFGFPTSKFASLGSNLTYSFNPSSPVPGLVLDASSAVLSGVPTTVSGPAGNNVTIEATNPTTGDTATESFKIRVLNRALFDVVATASFVVPDSQLKLFTGEISEDIVRRPHSYQYVDADSAFKPIREANDRSAISLELKPTGLEVSLDSVAEDDIAVWAQLKSESRDQLGSGTIPKGDTQGSMPFTIDATKAYDALVLVQEYNPLYFEMSLGDVETWPIPF